MKFSERTSWPSETNPWAEKTAAFKKSGRPFFDLTESNPTRCGLTPPPGILKSFQDAGNLKYEPDPQGLKIARDAVAAYYARKNTVVDPSRIFLTAGTSEAYSFLFRLLAEAGETVLAPEPGYPLFDFLSDLNDVTLEKYPLAYDGTWQIVPGCLEKKKARAVIVVNPNNPVGHFASAADIQELNGWAKANAAALISDEVFLDFPVLRGLTCRTLADNAPVLTFTLSGVSKILGLPQMKLSWIVVSGPETLCREACRRLEIISDTHLSVGTPVQRALPGWLEDGSITAAILERVRANHAALAAAFKGHPAATLLETEGGWTAVLRLRSGSDEEITLALLEKGVIVHPGYFYDFHDQACLVLSLLPEQGVFNAGLERLASGLPRP